MSYDENRISDQIDGGLHEKILLYNMHYMALIAVINTDEQPIEAIIRHYGDNVKDNEDSESYWLDGIEYCYHPVDVKEMPISELTIYIISRV
ncbi:MAG: hypothetical protein GY756_27065 [bacterium]|nr:hypothetical protein [bacterium]